jgi:hypothetical protein
MVKDPLVEGSLPFCVYKLYDKLSRQNPLQRGRQTPRAALAIPACGDDHFRVRRWAIPRAAFLTLPWTIKNLSREHNTNKV